MTAAALAPARSTPSSTVTTATIALLRVVGAGLLGASAGIHAYLWDVGYRSMPTILAGVTYRQARRGATTIPWW